MVTATTTPAQSEAAAAHTSPSRKKHPGASPIPEDSLAYAAIAQRARRSLSSRGSAAKFQPPWHLPPEALEFNPCVPEGCYLRKHDLKYLKFLKMQDH